MYQKPCSHFGYSPVCPCKIGNQTERYYLFLCSRSKFLSKILKILVKNFREIFPEFFFYSFANFNEKNSNLGGYKFGKTTDGKPGYIVPGGADTVLPFSQGIKLVYNNSSYASSYTFGEEGDYIVSSCVCKEGWNEKGDPVITLNVASIYANYQKTIYTGNNVETAVCFSYVHAKIGNTCTTTITGIDDTRHGYLTILKVG